MRDRIENLEIHNGLGIARSQIVAAVEALLAPSPSLYHTCNQERLRRKSEQITSLEQALEDTRAKGFAATAVLRVLANSDPSPQRPYRDVVTHENHEGAV